MKPDFFLRRIKAEFPEIRWKSCRYLTHGWDHVIIILDEKTVFRAPKDSRHKNEFQNEIQLLHYLKKKIKAGIPEYSYVSKDGSFAGYKILMGQELTVPRFRRLNASEKEIVAKQLAEFITALHSTPKSAIKKFHVKSDKQQKLYEELVRDTKKILFSRLGKSDVQLIEQYFDELENALDYTLPNTLVHNDLTDEHILWDARNKQINIIDFSDRSFGDPASDFAGLLEYGLRFTKRVFDLYCGKKDEHMLSRSQLYFKRIPLYIMKDSFLGFPCTFEQGYKMFKKRFTA
jgi:aminoglycoside 2''-phosphotransferase